MREIAGRLAPVLSIIQLAAPAEHELAALWRQIAERRAANMRRFAADLAAAAGSPPGRGPGSCSGCSRSTPASGITR
jgi:hypothetical protein